MPFKWIEATLWRNQTGQFKWFSHPVIFRLRLLAYKITGRWVEYAAVLCTSSFYREKAFKPAFSAKRFLLAGYPRNDFAQSLRDKHLQLLG